VVRKEWDMKFEVGKYYKRADGEKALCVHVWEGGIGLFIRPDKFGYTCHAAPDSGDITGEWKEPRKWTVYVVECNDSGGPWATLNLLDHHVILARHDMTEGDGL
jgi:hypothetical protein